jgi:hypothetical protein
MNAQPLTPVIPATKNQIIAFFVSMGTRINMIKWNDREFWAVACMLEPQTDNMRQAFINAWKQCCHE